MAVALFLLVSAHAVLVSKRYEDQLIRKWVIALGKAKTHNIVHNFRSTTLAMAWELSLAVNRLIEKP